MGYKKPKVNCIIEYFINMTNYGKYLKIIPKIKFTKNNISHTYYSSELLPFELIYQFYKHKIHFVIKYNRISYSNFMKDYLACDDPTRKNITINKDKYFKVKINENEYKFIML